MTSTDRPIYEGRFFNVAIPTATQARFQIEKQRVFRKEERKQVKVAWPLSDHVRHIVEEIDFWTVERGCDSFDVKCDVKIEQVKEMFELFGYFVEEGGNYGIVLNMNSSSAKK